MSDVINILPDHVANQIAAGEVIQRPASAVKELIENAIDAGADAIRIITRDAGKTLIQVIDNGKGMSETDARLCWERHATSKISDADDLFCIQTKGFRGEALASVAAISEVSLKTRPHDLELGTEIIIGGSQIQSVQPIACPAGSNFCIKNLFYNVPARRKFLKTDHTELRHIINEIHHVALAHPGITFQLYHNDAQIFNLPVSGLRQRIINIMGKTINQSLIPVHTDTNLIKISGFIGKPEFAKKKYGEQFFFVNNRYIRHPWFHRAIMQAYEQILQPEAIPSYFIYLETDPEQIDINIHPTKTEIKFESEKAIWQILHAAIRESIGKNNLSPSINFDREGIIDIPVSHKNTEIHPPKIYINPDFNPFNDPPVRTNTQDYFYQERGQNWDTLFNKKENHENPGQKSNSLLSGEEEGYNAGNFMQLKNKFILTPVKSGLMIIDQKRAHERIVYETTLQIREKHKLPSQKLLFPETIELNASDFVTFVEIKEAISELGFDMDEFGQNTITVNGIPETVKNSDIKSLIEEILEEYKAPAVDSGTKMVEKLAKSFAKASAIPYGKVLDKYEMRDLVDQLFACSNPNFSPMGKPVITIIRTEEIEKSLKV